MAKTVSLTKMDVDCLTEAVDFLICDYENMITCAPDDVHPDDIKAYERAIARLRRAADKLKG